MTKFVSNKNAETKQIHRLAGIHYGEMISINCYKMLLLLTKNFIQDISKRLIARLRKNFIRRIIR